MPLIACNKTENISRDKNNYAQKKKQQGKLCIFIQETPNFIGVQNNLDAKKIHLTPMRGMGVTALEYWNTGILGIVCNPIIPFFHYSITPGSFLRALK